MKSKLFAAFILVIFSFFSQIAFARDGYKINVEFTDINEDTKLFLCNYYAEAGGKAYRIDSIVLKKGSGVFQSKEKIVGGIYLLLFKDQSASMELILLNGEKMSIRTKKSDIVPSAVFKGKSENDLFYMYQRYLTTYGKEYQGLRNKLLQAKNKKDSTAIGEEMVSKSTELQDYRQAVIDKNPGTFLATLFLALKEPKVPKEWPNLETGAKDSSFPNRYYQAHYWDDFDFQDDRLVYTPIYGPKLKSYLDNWVVPDADSVKVVGDMILGKTEGTEHLFKYSLWYLTRWAETSKYMGMDEVFVYIVEEYHMKGKAPWLSKEDLKKYITKATRIAPNILGEPAKDLALYTMQNNKTTLYDVDAQYTLLIFYSATCGHCKKELPRIDSLYKNDLKNYGVKILAMETSNEVEKWKKFVAEKKLKEGWLHTYDPQRTTNYQPLYNAYTNPTIYLLDQEKKIVGKRLNHSNMLDLLNYLEKEKAKKKKK